MHRLLKRQIKQTFGKEFDINNLDKESLKLLELVTETYFNFDEEKQFLNHTVKENKKELKDAYDNMITSSRLAGIGEMMENITHQWKQPLSIILNIVSLLKLDIPESRDLKIIEEQTQYLDNTISDFTNFSSHSEEEKNVFSLEKSIQETMKIFDFHAKENAIILHTNLETNILINGNIGKFNQALLVIFSNAKDAFNSKRILHKTIEIKTHHMGDKIVICIQDNAGGIPEKIIDKIFEPYFTTKFKDKGTGIGLSMTYNIIDKMQGTIKVKNHKEGALFTITLPKVNQPKDNHG
jgi:signal transduction histidine kinase